MKGIAFVPGHISGFFEPVYSRFSLDRSGSRGAGISLSFGAFSHVVVNASNNHTISVTINGKKSSAPVTKMAIDYLIGDTSLDIEIQTSIHLPLSQGFGMSGAGALSATLALSNLLNISRENAVKAAHYAEIQSHTGLGDIVASCFGGIEIRRKAGLPPWGILEHIPGIYDIVLCVIGKKIETKKILTNKTKLEEIASYGRYCTKKLLQKPTLEHLFSLSWDFAQKINLMDSIVYQAIESAQHYGLASMCMLGNSVFAIGDTRMLCKTLKSFGKVFCCPIDTQGARILQEDEQSYYFR
jgi:pantoate kinase